MERNGARTNDTCYQPVPHAWVGMQLAKVLLTLTPKPVEDIMNNWAQRSFWTLLTLGVEVLLIL